MRGFLFIYTRLERFDYRLLYAPDTISLPSPIRESFVDFMREVVNTDNVNNGEIKCPRWALKKEGNHILIGLGCYNTEIGAETSGTEKRIIRGFFGVYLDSPCHEAIPQLTDINFYRQIYAQHVQPLWSLTRKDEYKTNSLIKEIDVECYPCATTSHIQLNERQDKCLTLSNDIPIDQLFHSALGREKTDVVCNLNTIDHVTCASLYSFHNVTIVGNKDGQIITLLKAKHTSTLESTSHEPKDSKSKERTKPSSRKFNRQKIENNDDEYADYVDILLRKLRHCRISIEKFLRIFAHECGYTLIPKEDTKEDKNSCYNVAIEKQDVLLSNQQEESIASKDIEQFKAETSMRKASVLDLRRQYLEQIVNGQEAQSIEEITEIDNHFQLDGEWQTIDDDNNKSAKKSQSKTLNIEEI